MQLNTLPNKFSFLLGFTAVCLGSMNLGYAHADTTHDAQEVSWLTRLAKSGNAGAQLQLGLAYQNGQYGLKSDPKSSFYWLSSAAQSGNAYAANLVGNHFATDKPAQLQEAAYWWKKAAHGGNSDAQVHLGEFMMHKGDDAQAVSWLRKAADRGDQRAHMDLASLYPSDDLKEADLLRGNNKVAVLAQEVSSASLKSLFALWRVIKTSSTYEQSSGPLIARAKQDDPVAEYQLAMRYRDGAWAVNSDVKKSMFWLQRSAAAGNRIAMKDLANIQLQTKNRLTVTSHAALSDDHT